ncbi:hypothetical protein ACLOJK_010567 [Asimina triloba]
MTIPKESNLHAKVHHRSHEAMKSPFSRRSELGFSRKSSPVRRLRLVAALAINHTRHNKLYP